MDYTKEWLKKAKESEHFQNPGVANEILNAFIIANTEDNEERENLIEALMVLSNFLCGEDCSKCERDGSCTLPFLE